MLASRQDADRADMWPIIARHTRSSKNLSEKGQPCSSFSNLLAPPWVCHKPMTLPMTAAAARPSVACLAIAVCLVAAPVLLLLLLDAVAPLGV
jgi:hypothetical protein